MDINLNMKIKGGKRTPVDVVVYGTAVNEKIITVHKASPIYQEDDIKSVTLRISENYPGSRELDLKEIERLFWDDAEKIVEALVESLPQGTLSKVHALLTKHAAEKIYIIGRSK